MRFLRKLGKPFAYIALVGFILWIAIFLWQATPIFMIALGPGVLWMASFFAVFFLLFLFVSACYLFTWLWGVLDERQHQRAIRKILREEDMREQIQQRRCG